MNTNIIKLLIRSILWNYPFFQYKNDESETEWTKDSTIVNMVNNANTR